MTLLFWDYKVLFRAGGEEEQQEADDTAAKEAEEAAQKELTLDEWKKLQVNIY